jgi:hypothetical protein
MEGGTVVAILERHPAFRRAKVSGITITVGFIYEAFVVAVHHCRRLRGRRRRLLLRLLMRMLRLHDSGW